MTPMIKIKQTPFMLRLGITGPYLDAFARMAIYFQENSEGYWGASIMVWGVREQGAES